MPAHPPSVRRRPRGRPRPEAAARSGARPRAGAGLRALRAALFTAVCVPLAAAGHGLGSCAAVPLWAVGLGCVGMFAVVALLAGRERALPGIAALLAGGQLALHTLFEAGQRHAAGKVGFRPYGPSGAYGHGSDGVVALARRLACAPGPRPMSAAEAHAIVVRSGIDPAVGHLGHLGHGGTGGTGAAGGSSACPPALLVSLLPSLPMVLGHLLAAVVAGWLLRRGEVAVWRVVRLSAESARSARGAAEEALVRALRTALRLVRALRAGLPGAPPRVPGAGAYGHGRREPGPRALVLQHSVIRRGPPAYGLAA
ncbi:hypothetical protein RKE29_18180 [Streptomyces sp. B1866]|uniref:hypothetical protein n=1 Tax=Streptomyces sp. B1866 TaxID=3075431 RepID=UPI0028913AD6|nr:hypothetical protein [Streptomyces sp. B1866]MDT3398552.1 hypothetical protein [Streptomyces sp. B1866]